MTRKLLLVGWDAADWKLIHPLLDSGQLPHLAKLVEGGVSGPLAGLNPPVSPLLWASLATGQTADRHGVLSDFQPDPFGGAPRPVSRQDWTRQPVWEIVAAQGVAVEAVNWPASHLAELHDPELHLRPEELYPEDLALFVPQLDRVKPADQPRMDQLAQWMSQTVTVHAIATDRLTRQPWAFAAVAYGLIGQAASAYRAETPDSPFGGVIAGAYRMLDLMLGTLIDIAGPEAYLMLVSTHGSDAAYRQNGIFCLAGPDVRQDELLHGAGLLDLAPTILALHGLPASQEMPGRVLAEAFLVAPPLPDRVARWEPIVETANGENSHQALDELAALGYRDTLAEDPATAAVRRQQHYHLAQLHLESNRAADALDLLDQAQGPERGTPQMMALELMRAYALLKLTRLDEAGEVVEKLCGLYPQAPEPLWAAANLALIRGERSQALTHLRKAESIAPPTASLHCLLGRVYLELRQLGEAEKHFRAALALDPTFAPALRELSLALFQLNNLEGAAEAALEAVGLEYSHAQGHYLLGAALARLGRLEPAQAAFKAALHLNPQMKEAQAALERLQRRQPAPEPTPA